MSLDKIVRWIFRKRIAQIERGIHRRRIREEAAAVLGDYGDPVTDRPSLSYLIGLHEHRATYYDWMLRQLLRQDGITVDDPLAQDWLTRADENRSTAQYWRGVQARGTVDALEKSLREHAEKIGLAPSGRAAADAVLRMTADLRRRYGAEDNEQGAADGKE